MRFATAACMQKYGNVSFATVACAKCMRYGGRGGGTHTMGGGGGWQHGTRHHIYIYIPGTQMTLVLNGKGLFLEGSNPKIEDKQVTGIYIHCFFFYLMLKMSNPKIS